MGWFHFKVSENILKATERYIKWLHKIGEEKNLSKSSQNDKNSV